MMLGGATLFSIGINKTSTINKYLVYQKTIEPLKMAAEKSQQKITALCWRKISSIISYYFQIEKSDVRTFM